MTARICASSVDGCPVVLGAGPFDAHADSARMAVNPIVVLKPVSHLSQNVTDDTAIVWPHGAVMKPVIA